MTANAEVLRLRYKFSSPVVLIWGARTPHVLVIAARDHGLQSENLPLPPLVSRGLTYSQLSARLRR